MADPKVAGLEPKHIELEQKTYFWCSCGHSENQPFCDGSHNKVEGGFTPVEFKMEEKKEVWLCMCKHTGNPPFCDGMHCNMKENR